MSYKKQKNYTLPQEKIDYIINNSDKKSFLQISKDLGLTKGVVNGNLGVYKASLEDRKTFQVNDLKNWLI